METLLIITHIAAGFMALAAGLGAMLLDKTSRGHVISGRMYYYAMLTIFLTGVPMSVVSENWFLFGISFFAFYLAHSGMRFARRKERTYSLLDKGIAGGFALLSIATLGYAGYLYQAGLPNSAIILGIFGGIFLASSGLDSLVFWGLRPKKHHWVRSHIGRMGGSYIAAVTAFSVNVIDFLPGMVTWLAPTVIGTIILSRTTRYYVKKWNLQPKPTKSAAA